MNKYWKLLIGIIAIILTNILAITIFALIDMNLAAVSLLLFTLLDTLAILVLYDELE